MAQLRVALAGALTMTCGDLHVGHRAFGGVQLPVVTTVLVLNRDRPVPRERLVADLWPAGRPTQWRVAIRGLVSRLRRNLVEVGFSEDVIVAASGSYRIELGDVEVDVETVPTNLERARILLADDDVAGARRHASMARQVASRPVLPGIDAPTLAELRIRLDRHRVESLELLADCRVRAGEYADAVTVASESVGLDPFREESWRHLLHAHAKQGNVAVALREYDRMRRLFVEELGVDPSPQTRQLHAQLLRRTVEGVARHEPVSPPPSERVPFRGLLPFRTEDAPFFFGRDAQVQGIVARLGRAGAVVVTGPSGSGKSSLVRAGVLPALTAGALPEADTWVAVTLRPGHAPVEALASAIGGQGRVDGDTVERLWTDEDAVVGLARELLRQRRAAPAARLLVVVDQAEELFTVCQDDGQRRRFVAALLEATRGPAAPVLVVLTLRDDFHPVAAGIPDLAELLSTSVYVVPPLDGEGYEAAIVGPARAVGVRLDAGLVGRVMADVSGRPGSLPQLQHAMLELWHRRDGDRLTIAAYDQIGGVAGALAQRAESVLADLDEEEQTVARRLLLRTVTPGPSVVTRRQVTLAELERDVAGRERVEVVVRSLVDARLLVSSTDSLDRPVVEVAHERLVTAWPRFAAWIEDARADLVIGRRIGAAAAGWVDHDRHPDFLLTGRPLAEVAPVVDRSPELLNHLEREFLSASRDRDEQRRGRRRRRRRLVTGLLAGSLVAAVALAAVSIDQRNRARRLERIARADTLAAEARTAMEADHDLALLLGLAATGATGIDEPPTAAAVGALHDALDGHRTLQTIPDAVAIGTVEPGQLFLGQDEDRDAVVWDVARGEVAVTLEGSSGPTWDGASGGTTVVVVTGPPQGEARVYDATSGEMIDRVPTRGQPDWAAVSADGSLVAVVDVAPADAGGARVIVWDVENRQQRHALSVDPSTRGLAFDHDNRLIAVVAEDPGGVDLYDLDTGRLARRITPAGMGSPTAATFTAEGELAVLSRGPGLVLFVDPASGTVRRTVSPSGSRPSGVCVDEAGQRTLVAMPNVAVEAIDLADPDVRVRLPSGGALGEPLCDVDDDVAAITVVPPLRTVVSDVSPQGQGEVWAVHAPMPAFAVGWVEDAVVAGHVDGSLRRYEDGREVAAVDPGLTAFAPYDIAVSPDGRFVAGRTGPPPEQAGPDVSGQVVLFDGATLDVVREISVDGVPVGFTPDSGRLVVRGIGPEVFVVDVAKGTVDRPIPIRGLSGDQSATWATVLADGRHVVHQWGTTLDVHDLDTGELVATTCVAANGFGADAGADGTLLALEQVTDRRILVLDVTVILDTPPGRDCEPGQLDTRAVVTTLESPVEGDVVPHLTGDGVWLVGSDADGITVWDPRTGRVAARMLSTGRPWTNATSADGRRLAVAVEAVDGSSIRVMTLDFDELVQIARARASRALTDDECQRYELVGGACTDPGT